MAELLWHENMFTGEVYQNTPAKQRIISTKLWILNSTYDGDIKFKCVQSINLVYLHIITAFGLFKSVSYDWEEKSKNLNLEHSWRNLISNKTSFNRIQSLIQLRTRSKLNSAGVKSYPLIIKSDLLLWKLRFRLCNREIAAELWCSN